MQHSHSLNIFYRKRKKINLIRPLLVLNRFQTLKICAFFIFPINIDSTNKLVNFRRNRLRIQILPLFKIFFNPKVDMAIDKAISIINCENNYFTNHLKYIEKYIKVKKFKFKTLKRIKEIKWLIFLPEALQKKIYKQLLTSRFKSLTFSEIEFLFKVNVLLFK